MKNAFQITLLFLLVGCGGALNNSWTNFRSYYNTYYNAKENYQAGLQSVKGQSVQMDVTQPVRVHEPPLQSGSQDFQQAIDKGAQLLRKFPESKWVDETLELIGKSYYYRQEYYSALQKFEEQYNMTQSPEMRQRAVIWKGRVLLDMEQYSQGLVFLEEQRTELADEWTPDLLGEAEILLGEHAVQLEQWEQAEDYLTSGLGKLEKGPLKARSYFLYGQVLEISERYEEASFAYGRARQNRPGFELLYWTNFKQAEVLRKMGDLDRALAIYEQMRKDDKNVDRLPEIYYEIARTHEAIGNIELAEQLYKDVLRNDSYQVTQKTRSDIYYRLGQINSTYFKRFNLAAAYYDSSSSLSITRNTNRILEEDRNTETLARAYGQYSTLKSEIAEQDSLLWLGSLPQSEFDSVLNVIKQQKLQQLRQEQSRRGNNVLANVSSRQQPTDDRTSGTYGFLNYRNSRLVVEARASFRAVWGNRALVDNWRRIEAVRNTRQPDSSDDQPITQRRGQAEQDDEAAQLQIDLSKIPFNEQEKEEVRNQITSNQYELGNLFMLTLQNQDSAAYYFKKVIRTNSDHPLVPRALYSLYELNTSQGNTEEARRWAERLKEQYPQSDYTRELRKRLGEEGEDPILQVSSDSTNLDLPARASSIMTSRSSTGQIAKELRNLALANSSNSAASTVHFEAIKRYIALARQRDELNIMAALPDSVSGDSTAFYSSLKPRFAGAYWDSVRTVLQEHQQQFSDESNSRIVQKLSEELDSAGDENVSESAQNVSQMPTCEDYGVNPKVTGGIEQFMTMVQYPEDLEDENLSGTIEYQVQIAASGEVQGFERVSQNTGLGIEEALEQTMESYLSFDRLSLEDSTMVLNCRISFPIVQ